MRGVVSVSARLCCAALPAFCVVLALPGEGHSQQGGPLRIATWGGAYVQSQEAAYFRPFTQESGIAVETQTYDGTLAAIKSTIDGSAPVDVIDVSRATLDTLCRDGQLESIPPTTAVTGPEGQAASEDYLASGLSSCGVASVTWSAAVAYDRQALKARPGKISDLLDVKRFPGKRALPKTARYTLEFALQADGVAPADIYTTLGTPEGVDRAFAALEKMKGQMLWWTSPQQPIAWLVQKKAVMAVGYSGRLFRAIVGAKHLDILWDGQIYDVDHWAIPKSAPNKDAANKFLAFASAPARMAAQAELIAYGPMRKSAIGLVGKHPAIGVDMKQYLPTAPENFANALPFDAAWWAQNGEPLETRFAAWLAKQAEAPVTSAAPEKPRASPPQPRRPQAQQRRRQYDFFRD
jgi:putative spermidine/putrescine transport system substrate-binding protein